MEIKAQLELRLGMATREVFGKALVDLGHQNKNVVALDADLSKSTYTHLFDQEFPETLCRVGSPRPT
jgi:transketolase